MTTQELQTAIIETQKIVDWNHKHSSDWPYVQACKDKLIGLLQVQLKLAKGE